MAMNGNGFTNYYFNSSRLARRSDLECFFWFWKDAYGTVFNNSSLWNADSEYRVPKVCGRVRTAMLSRGCDKPTADRVLKYFKAWYKDTYT